MKKNPEHLKLLESWMRWYKPEELFDQNGKLRAEFKEIAPTGTRRMGSNPHANGGRLKKGLRLPDFRQYALKLEKPGVVQAENIAAPGRVFARRDEVQHDEFPGVSGRTKPPPTNWMIFMKRARNSGSRSIFRRTRTAENWRPMDEWSRC